MGKSNESVEQQWVPEREAHRITTISLAKLRKDRAQGRGIPYVKVGKSVRYSISDIYDYMNSRRIETK